MDTTGIIIIILIVCAGGFVVYKIVSAVSNKIDQNKAAGKSAFWWRVLLNFLCFLMLSPRIHRAQTRKHLHKTNQTPQQTLKTNDNSTIESSDGHLYFMSMPIGFLDDEGTMYLTDCVFTEPSQTSCNIQCQKLTITYNMRYSELKEQIQCEQGVKQINYSNEIKFSNIYYIEPEAACVNHTTEYDVEQLSQKNCPDISCRLLKQYIIKESRFPFSCDAPYGFESFMTKLINKQDFLEFRTPKLRDEKEFERLYEKYYKD